MIPNCWCYIKCLYFSKYHSQCPDHYVIYTFLWQVLFWLTMTDLFRVDILHSIIYHYQQVTPFHMNNLFSKIISNFNFLPKSWRFLLKLLATCNYILQKWQYKERDSANYFIKCAKRLLDEERFEAITYSWLSKVLLTR